mmetsp:Transcript_22901/g.50628  ORF Transcript_22901/g.50628 Transcript_22901/m.50628 type:complete len:342 (-) Transcript_22901:164-1189(-)
MARHTSVVSGRKRSSSRLFAYVALGVFAAQLLGDLQLEQDVDFNAFAVPSAAGPLAAAAVEELAAVNAAGASASPGFGVRGNTLGQPQGRFSERTGLRAEPVTIASRVINAMGAGAVASVIQAALSAVGEPIVNRVLVKRMKIMDAVRDVSPMQMLKFFQTTLITNFLKFPFFEAINAFCACFPVSSTLRGIFTGFVFTTVTLPVTNYRYRKSMDLPVQWGNIYEAYFPTVIRDMVYGIARNFCTIWVLAAQPGWTNASPQCLFTVVIFGCLASAPFNEWRGFLLQSKGQELSFSDFFKPSNFLRSTFLGALKQGLALAVGYWCAPPVRAYINGLISTWRH